MTKDDLIQDRLGQIRSAIEARPEMLSVSLPQENETLQTLRDNDCDIQFTLVVTNGAKGQYLNDLSWLMDIQHIAFTFCRCPGHFRFLFSDGIYCDLTVLDQQEFASHQGVNYPFASLRKGQSGNPQLIAPEEPPQNSNAIEQHDTRWLMGELLTNLLIGLRRYTKGDKLSAFYLIQHHGLSRLLALIAKWEANQDQAKSRISNTATCFEQSYPQVASKVSQFALGYDQSPQSAFAILKYVEQHENVNYFLKDQLLNLIQPHSNLH